VIDILFGAIINNSEDLIGIQIIRDNDEDNSLVIHFTDEHHLPFISKRLDKEEIEHLIKLLQD
jgi:hypothetical protein